MSKIQSIMQDAPAAPQILYDGDHVQLIHIPADSEYTLVTFDIMHARANGLLAFASKLAASKGINFYGIVPKHPCWYPHAETLAACEIVAAAKDRPSLAYGSSMGGYGALKYGKAAGADVALSFAPQATIDPAVLGKDDPRYGKFFKQDLHGSDMLVTTTDLPQIAYIGYDPMVAPDRFQAELLPQHPELHHVHLTFMGHQCAKAMTPSAHGLAIFQAAFAKDDALVSELMRANREQSISYFIGMATTLRDNDKPAFALTQLEGGMDRHGWDKEAALLRAKLLIDLDRPTEGLADIQRVAEAQPHVSKYRIALVNQFEAIGDMDAALSELQDAAEEFENPILTIRLGKMYRELGQDTAADELIADATVKWPERTAHFQKI